jgi:hypothetical protein
MGDEELNFTEEEAQCWADDPRNQAQPGQALSRPFAVCLLLVIAVLIFFWLATSPGEQHRPPGTRPISVIAVPVP